MSELILLNRPQRAQISEKERSCVLVDGLSGRILCFARDVDVPNPPAGVVKTILYHASDYDSWSAKWRKQEQDDQEQADYATYCKEEPVRKEIRSQLARRIGIVTEPRHRRYIETMLRVLDMQLARQKRMHTTFMMAEGYEEKSAAHQFVSDGEKLHEGFKIKRKKRVQ